MSYSTLYIALILLTVLFYYTFTTQAYSQTQNNYINNIEKISSDSKDNFGSLSRNFVEEDNKKDDGDEDKDEGNNNKIKSNKN